MIKTKYNISSDKKTYAMVIFLSIVLCFYLFKTGATNTPVAQKHINDYYAKTQISTYNCKVTQSYDSNSTLEAKAGAVSMANLILDISNNKLILKAGNGPYAEYEEIHKIHNYTVNSHVISALQGHASAVGGKYLIFNTETGKLVWTIASAKGGEAYVFSCK